MKKIISFVLALVTVISCFAVTTVATSAATVKIDDYMDVLTDAYDHSYASASAYVTDQVSKGYMKLMARAYGYELYCNEYTGEMAYVNVATGQVLTSNPYDFSELPQTGTEADPTKSSTHTNLLSQVEVRFVDNENKERTFTSFVEAAARGQIAVKYMNNGFRVEYTMGRLNTTYLLPGFVYEKDFVENILDPFELLLEEIADQLGDDSEEYIAVEAYLMKIEAWYLQVSYDTVDSATAAQLAKNYPVFAEKDEKGNYSKFRILDENSDQAITDKERVTLENLLKNYCPDLDFDLLDSMHAKTGYVADVNETPVFRAAIEYILEADGLSVRLPASSVRFDETKYTLQYIKILQYFGAGNLKKEGYVFYPDGSGAIIEFSEFYSKDNNDNREAFTLSGTVYGEDFAYYDIDQNSKHAEVIRVPVFGIVEQVKMDVGTKDTGFMAILEDGDALSDIATFFGGGEFNYASAYTMFYPRPSDAYNLSEAISVADNKEMTIVSEKKYTGFYTLKYMMLFDENDLTKAPNEPTERYFASYSGMAGAYRDYLLRKNIIENRTETDVTNGQLPLYIETLGSVETTKKILSIPVNVDVPLASFTDIMTMYNQLAKKGITNINFKLTGYANGGLDAKYPQKVKWLSAVGGASGFEELSTFAAEKGIGIYPEFEFSYSSYEGGIKLRKHASRAVDDRYCSKQLYDPVYQEFASYFDVCISPVSIYEFVSEFTEYYSEYNPSGISVSTLGSDLNSDFNKDAPLNRQDAQGYIKDALALLDKEYKSVMAEGGNIYTVEYLDHILNLPLDASKYKYESKAVPFLGMVLHGYANYAGGVINEAGDSSLQLLKSIENGALLYYMLIYQNSSLLKEDQLLSQYYSVRFDIWFNTIVEQYEMLNGAIGDLQLYEIVDHDFLIGERVPLANEVQAEIDNLNKLIETDLVSQYNTYVAAQRRVIRIQQLTQEMIRSGVVTADALYTKVAFALGSALTENDMLVIDEHLASYMAGEPFVDNYGASIPVKIDRAALEAAITAITGTAVTDAQKEVLDRFEATYCTNSEDAYTINSFGVIVKLKDHSTPSFAQDAIYISTDYTEDSGRIVLVTYAKGDSKVHFVLNYNTYAVTVRLKGINGDTAFEVAAGGFVRINGNELAK